MWVCCALGIRPHRSSFLCPFAPSGQSTSGVCECHLPEDTERGREVRTRSGEGISPQSRADPATHPAALSSPLTGSILHPRDPL